MADLTMQKMPFFVRAVYACIKHPCADAVSSYLDNMARRIHQELGENGVYLGVCMQPEYKLREKNAI